MIEIFFDGACEPKNPGGTASYGFIVLKEKKELYSESGIIAKGERASNNVAEYGGLLKALRWLYKNNYQKQNITCCGDSKLVIEQMSGNWKIKKGLYVDWAYKCLEALKYFPNTSLEWIPKEENTKADRLSRDVL